MNYFIAFVVLGICFGLMAVGLIFARKILRKGCSLDPSDCTCRKEAAETGTPSHPPTCKNKDRGK